MAAYTQTGRFKARMRRLYPRTNIEKQPMLFFALEFFIRKVVAIEPPKVTDEFKSGVARSMEAASLLTRLFLDDPASRVGTGRHYWPLARAAVNKNLGRNIRRHSGGGEMLLLRDLKRILLKDPL